MTPSSFDGSDCLPSHNTTWGGCREADPVNTVEDESANPMRRHWKYRTWDNSDQVHAVIYSSSGHTILGKISGDSVEMSRITKKLTTCAMTREVRTTDQELRLQAKTPCQQVVLKTLRINIEIKKESPKRSSYVMVVVPIHFKWLITRERYSKVIAGKARDFVQIGGEFLYELRKKKSSMVSLTSTFHSDLRGDLRGEALDEPWSWPLEKTNWSERQRAGTETAVTHFTFWRISSLRYEEINSLKKDGRPQRYPDFITPHWSSGKTIDTYGFSFRYDGESPNKLRATS